MIHLMRVVDRALGYAFIADTSTTTSELSPPTASSSSSDPQHRLNHDNRHALFSSAAGLFPNAPKVQDVQERWVDSKQVYDEWEEQQWKMEGERAALDRQRSGR